MGRITKVTGEFMGVRFEVKPTPIRFDKVMDERRDMLLGWYKKNHPSLHEKIISDDYDVEDEDAAAHGEGGLERPAPSSLHGGGTAQACRPWSAAHRGR